MLQDDRAPFVSGLHRARVAAYPAGEYVGQESFMRAGEIGRLARRAGIGPGLDVLDLCCGTAGPGQMITAELGCRYVGVDYSASALALARAAAGELPCRFAQARVPPLPLPAAACDVVVLLETMLAFRDKDELLAEIARVLTPGGRFAATVEVGAPLSAAERSGMPDADTVWPVEWDELGTLMAHAGLAVSWTQDCTSEHHATALALTDAFRADADGIAEEISAPAFAELLAAHELWIDWLGSTRVRKLALVATKR